MLCLKKRRTYSFTQGVCTELPRRTKEDGHRYEGSLNMAITTLPRKNRTREERPSRMVLTVTEDTPADMLAGSMELLVQLPRDHHLQTQRVTVQRSTPMMDLLVQIATAHKLAASSYTLQAIGERGMVLPHQPNTPIGALDALQVKLLPKQGAFVPRKTKQPSQPFETTFRLQVHLPRNQLYVSRVSPKMNLGEILEEVCREKGLDKNKYELRHPANLETLDLSLSLQDYHLQEVTLYAKQGRTLGSALSTQDIMALQRQEERRRQQAKQSVFGFVFKKSKEGSLSTDSLGGRSASPARSDETGRSTSPLQPPTRPQRKRRPAPRPPTQAQAEGAEETPGDSSKDKVVISHSRNSSDSSGYHEASVLSDNPDSAGRLPETLPRRNKAPLEMPRKLAQTSQSSKSLSNLASVPGTLSHGISSTSLSSTGLRKKRAAPPPPVTRPLSSAISTQALERIIDSEESLTSDMDPSKPPSDIGVPSKANSDIEERPKASSDIGVTTVNSKLSSTVDFTKTDCHKSEAVSKNAKSDLEPRQRSGSLNVKLPKTEPSHSAPVEDAPVDARMPRKRVGEPVPLPKPRAVAAMRPEVPKRKLPPSSTLNRTPSSASNKVDGLSNTPAHQSSTNDASSSFTDGKSSSGSVRSSCRSSTKSEEKMETASDFSTSEDDVFLTPRVDQSRQSLDSNSFTWKEEQKKTDSLCTEAESKEKLNIDEDKENVEASSNQSNALRRKEEGSVPAKDNFKQEKKLCAVISTIPKCEHLNALSVDYTISQSKEKEGSKDPKRAKIPRTASKLNDFETNSLERQKRHLTSHAEDITFALNLNVASNVGLKSNEKKFNADSVQRTEEEQNAGSRRVDGENSHFPMGASDTNLSETDVLLQKVSDTLSNSLPVSSSIEMPISPIEVISEVTNICEGAGQKEKKNVECLDGFIANTSTPNLTVSSQQDTSDYVSAADEDLAVTEWEYQLPAPPSAFRDSSSPVFDNFESIDPTPGSFGPPKIQEPVKIVDTRDPKNNLETIEKRECEERMIKSKIKQESLQENCIRQQKSELNLKKEVISELENKIGTPHSSKDSEFRRVVSNPSTPKIAPVDNTLSNFTITTYSRQKSLNIFDEVKEHSKVKEADERFVRSFATLSRNRSNSEQNGDTNPKDIGVEKLQEKKKIVSGENGLSEKKLEPKIQAQTLQRRQSGNEKGNIQRSKSYISVCEKPSVREKMYAEETVKNEKNLEMEDEGMKKATSISNLNATAPKSNEKFSQWRDNILKRQENPTKEKQLQSLQVLKSILPQLKNAQQAEENVPKESSDTVLSGRRSSETTSNEHSIGSNVVSTREPRTTPSEKKMEPEPKKLNPEVNTKRYTYSGPPTINLGSWSERPSANVHIKMDRDYKIGTKQSSNKTVININGTRDEVDSSINTENSSKLQKSEFEVSISNRREPNELAKKLITHTTASGFKKPVLNKINSSEPKISNDKPVITGVELKKSFRENNKQDDNVVDTTPVNFKDLTKAFGQEVCLRPKPKRSSLNQRPNSQSEDDSSQQNGHLNSDHCLMNGHQGNTKPKRFTSIVGIQAQSQGNVNFRNDINIRGNHLVPVVKGFKASNTNGRQSYENSKEPVKEELSNGTQPPRPPTMPVITGVTLKSARPKSMPVQMDRRDILLESIRNFGGRENLKSAAERC